MYAIVKNMEEARSKKDRTELVFKAVKMLKATNDIRQKDLAMAIGVSQGMLNQYLLGKKHMSDTKVMQLCWFLGIDPIHVRPSLTEFINLAKENL